MTLLMRAMCALLIGACLPAQALANSLVPSERWTSRIAVASPLVPYKMGLVSLTAGSSAIATELPTAVRSLFKQAGFLDVAAPERVHVDIAVKTLSDGAAVVEYTARRAKGTAPANVIYRQVISARTPNRSMSTEVTDVRVLSGNLKLFAIDFRQRFDPAFALQAAPVISDVQAEVDSRGILSHVGEAAMNTMVATVEGTAAVAGAMGEVVTNPEFQQGMVHIAGQVAQQQQELNAERARIASLQAAAMREREARAAADRLAVQQRELERKQELAARQAEQSAQQTAQRTAALERQRAATERQARQKTIEQQRAAEQARRIAEQQRAGSGHGAIIVAQLPPAQVSPTPQPRPIQPPPQPPAEEFSVFGRYSPTPKNLNCNAEKKCKQACPRNQPDLRQCRSACEARSTCTVSEQ